MRQLATSRRCVCSSFEGACPRHLLRIESRGQTCRRRISGRRRETAAQTCAAPTRTHSRYSIRKKNGRQKERPGLAVGQDVLVEDWKRPLDRGGLQPQPLAPLLPFGEARAAGRRGSRTGSQSGWPAGAQPAAHTCRGHPPPNGLGTGGTLRAKRLLQRTGSGGHSAGGGPPAIAAGPLFKIGQTLAASGTCAAARTCRGHTQKRGWEEGRGVPPPSVPPSKPDIYRVIFTISQ